jgi:Peptidase family M28/PDZ domain/PA domain
MKRLEVSSLELRCEARSAINRMRQSRPFQLLILLASLAPLSAREPVNTCAAASSTELRRTVEFLASEELAGRMTGSEGSRLAADYLAARLQGAGLQPGGDKGTFFQEFEFSAGVRVLPEENSLLIETKEGGTSAFTVEKDFLPLAFSGNGSVSGEVVFAGYGLRVPGKEGRGYDSYAGLDVKDKIVLVFRYVPEDVSPERRAELNRYAGLRYKALIAREHGAKALLVVTGPNSPGAGELVSIASDAGMTNSAIPAASISLKTAEALLATAGKDLKLIQTQLDSENPHADSGFVPSGVTVRLTTAIERIRKTDRNVIGILPPSGAMTRAPPQYILVGAHYDHLGHGEVGAMRRKGEETSIHYGADDNASGVTVVLAMAEALAEQRKNNAGGQRGLIFAFWSGEEIGLIGSSFYADHPEVGRDQIVAYINFDMVGRLRENKLNIQGIGSSSGWKKLLEKRNVAAGFQLALQEDPYLPTDSMAFYLKGIPCINFFTGSHEDYHRPTDTADTLNYEGLERITRFACALASDLDGAATRPDFVKVERSSPNGARENLRVYIGSIPDYTAEISGVKLAGVRSDSPADRGGLKAGDVIIEFAGQKITNIYDYTYALDSAKIGQPVQVVIQRDGHPQTLSVIPEARK